MVVVKRVAFTIFLFCIAFFLQGLLIATSPKLSTCSEFQNQLFSMGKPLFIECLLIALALFYTLRQRFRSAPKVAGAYTLLFAVGCLLSFVLLVLDYRKDCGC
jgi:hydrogenase-4 membrane subunit HyfE